MRGAERKMRRAWIANRQYKKDRKLCYFFGVPRIAFLCKFADPEFPVLRRPAHETVKIGADNPDNYYQSAAISGAQVRVQILDHDETLLSLAPDPVIGDARASLSADVGTQQVALTIRGSPLPGQAAGTVQLNSWFIANDPKDASLQAVAVVAAMPGGNSMQGVRATITPDFRSPEASAAGFVAHASAVEHAGLEDQYTVSVPAGSPYSRFIAVPRQDDAHLAFRIEDATGGWSAWSHVDPERASSGGLLSDGRATGLREYVAPVQAAAVKDFRVHLRVTSADGTATRDAL